MPKKFKTVLHLLFWLLLSVLIFFAFGRQIRVLRFGSSVEYFTHFAYYMLFLVGIDMVLKATFAYTNMHLLIPGDKQAPNSRAYILRFTLLGLATCLLSALASHLIIQNQDLMGKQVIWYWFMAILHVFVGLSSIGLKLAGDKRVNEQKQKEVEAAQLNSELDFLKSQINPHFLFNTLNNLYGSAQLAGAEDTAQGIGKLSGIMRYMMDEKNQGMVPLTKEISYIRDFMALQDLRVHKNDPVNISFNVEGDVDRVMIAPLILIPFVENAFKHGISIENESLIEIGLEVNGQELKFIVKNTVHREMTSGTRIGLENVSRRLALIYPDKHILNISDNDSIYLVDLRIGLEMGQVALEN